jgi:hypothetical protein
VRLGSGQPSVLQEYESYAVYELQTALAEKASIEERMLPGVAVSMQEYNARKDQEFAQKVAKVNSKAVLSLDARSMKKRKGASTGPGRVIKKSAREAKRGAFSQRRQEKLAKQAKL